MSDTKQRLDDLIAVADNKEVKLLANIMKDYVIEEKKETMGFKEDLNDIKKGSKNVKRY